MKYWHRLDRKSSLEMGTNVNLAVFADGSTFFDGLSVDNATGIVDQLRLPRFKAYTNYDNYVGVGT